MPMEPIRHAVANCPTSPSGVTANLAVCLYRAQWLENHKNSRFFENTSRNMAANCSIFSPRFPTRLL